MRYDDEFEPRLGKIRSRGGKRGRRYLRQVLRAVALAGGKVGSGAKPGRSTFPGNRIGRGAGVGRILAARHRYAAVRVRRALVKKRIVKIGKGGLKAARTHRRYIHRTGGPLSEAPRVRKRWR